VWRAQLTPQAQALAGSLPIEEPLDLMDRYATPLCLSLAAMVTGISRYDAEDRAEIAQRVRPPSVSPMTPLSAPARGLRTLHFGVAIMLAHKRSGVLGSWRSRNYTLPAEKRVVRADTNPQA
jgi:hypothetical protein